MILAGKPGRGRTHLAIAIAYRAVQNGFDVLFTTAAKLIEDLSMASRQGRMTEALAEYVRPHVLIVDELGYLAYGDDAAGVLYHVVNDRDIRRRSMIFTTNKSPKRWGEALHDEDLAEAIVDRILERGRLLRLDGLRSERSTWQPTTSPMMKVPAGSKFPERAAQNFRNAQKRIRSVH